MFYFPISYGQQTSSCTSGSLTPLDTTNIKNVSMAHSAAVLASIPDLKNFCVWNRMGRMAQSLEGAAKVQYAEARSIGDQDQAAKILLANRQDLDHHWIASLSGHSLLKNQSRNSSLTKGTSARSPIKIDDVSEYAKTGKIFRSEPAKQFAIPERFLKARKLPSVSRLEKTAVCFYVAGLLKINECSKNLDSVLEYAAPLEAGKGGTTAVPSFMRILGDPSYEQGLKRVTEKMHNNLIQKNVSGDLFSDVQQAFVDSGDEASIATNKSWEVMTVLAATGPNMAPRLKDIINSKIGTVNPNAIYLSGIATMIPHLDTIAMQSSKPRLYSLPNDVNFPCDSGKSYHFWMSAYLSRMLLKKGSSQESAAGAAYIAELGYQMRSDTLGRDPSKINELQRFGNTEMGILIDLNLAAAGAKYGSLSETKDLHGIDIEKGFRDSIKTMGEKPTLSTSNARPDFWNYGHFRWINNYNPISTLQLYK